MTVVWNRPSVDGGSDINGYFLEKREKKSLRWFKVIKETIRDTRQKVSGLTEGSEYQYRVSAVNAAGEGPFSDASDFYKAADPIDPPGEPTKLKVVDSTKSSITLEWVKPVYDGGSNITGYVVEKREQGEEDWTMISSKGEIRTTEYVVSHLKPGINYFFRVSALNCAGTGEPLEMTEPVQECEIDLDVALRTQITAKAGENVEILIPFKGRPAPNVTWRKGEKNITQDPRYHISNTESSTLLTIEQVTRDDSGKYVLSIENGVGEPKTSFVNIKVFDTPGPCQKLIVKHVSRGNVTLAWEPPLINGGSEITNYVIEKRDATKRAYSSVTTKCAHTTFKISGLSEKTPFFFRVLAENETGLGEPCETAEPVKATEVPGPIKDLSMKDSTKTSLPYKGKPRPTMQWLKDNLPLKESEQRVCHSEVGATPEGWRQQDCRLQCRETARKRTLAKMQLHRYF
uniref:Titin n=1 Tax=Erpetoichthys calabaricus TaxID=27687 RepID=A0A8C4S356_ERPCA